MLDERTLSERALAEAEWLESSAKHKRNIIGNRTTLTAGPMWWSQRLVGWAGRDDHAARMIRVLVAEIERRDKATS